MAVDMRWLTAGEDEEDIELRHAELGTWFDCGGFDAAQAHADLAEMARLSERYGGWVSVGRTLHGSGAIVEKRYDLQHGRGGDAGWVEDITARVLADGQGNFLTLQ